MKCKYYNSFWNLHWTHSIHWLKLFHLLLFFVAWWNAHFLLTNFVSTTVHNLIVSVNLDLLSLISGRYWPFWNAFLWLFYNSLTLHKGIFELFIKCDDCYRIDRLHRLCNISTIHHRYSMCINNSIAHLTNWVDDYEFARRSNFVSFCSLSGYK